MAKSSSSKDILQLDLYALLEIEPGCSEKGITKAYRKKALKVHPDKNKDNPKAAEEFHILSDALKILTDAPAKAAYDKLYNGRKLHEVRTKALSDKRKKMRMDLEARENRATTGDPSHLSSFSSSPSFFRETTEEAQAQAQLEREVIRLRAEWSATLEAQQAELRRRLAAEREEAEAGLRVACGLVERSSASCTPKFKVKWKSEKDDPTNGGYTREFLLNILQQYGKVPNLLVSGKRKGSAIAEFKNRDDAVAAHTASSRDELGFPDNPMKLDWLEGRTPPPSPPVPTFAASTGSSVNTGTRTTSHPQGKRTLESMEADILSRMFQASKPASSASEKSSS